MMKLFHGRLEWYNVRVLGSGRSVPQPRSPLVSCGKSHWDCRVDHWGISLKIPRGSPRGSKGGAQALGCPLGDVWSWPRRKSSGNHSQGGFSGDESIPRKNGRVQCRGLGSGRQVPHSGPLWVSGDGRVSLGFGDLSYPLEKGSCGKSFWVLQDLPPWKISRGSPRGSKGDPRPWVVS